MDEYVIVEKSSLNNIADTVRGATGSADSIAVSDLSNEVAAAIASGGGDTILGTDGKLLNSVLPDGYPYSEVDTDGVIVETQTSGGGRTIIASATPVIGETYTVMIDGVSHKCVAWEYSDGLIVIGNGNYVGLEGIGEDVPFAFGFVKGDPKAYFFANGECTFSIRGLVETIHPLDKKFVPFNLDGYRRFGISETNNTEMSGGATIDDVSPDQRFYVCATNKSVNTPLYVNASNGWLGFPNSFISNLVVYSGELNLSTLTEQIFSTKLNERGYGKLLMLDIRDTDSKKRFAIDVGFALSSDYVGYTETIEKVAPMNGINYLITITGPFVSNSGTYTITIKKLSAVT